MDSNILRKQGFSLIEIVFALVVAIALISIVFYSSAKRRDLAKAERILNELDAIATACTQYYNDNGAWPSTFADLKVKYFNSAAQETNPWGNAYSINGEVSFVTVSTLLPKNLLSNKSFGSQIIITNQGSNDLVSVTKPVITSNWRLKYDKKYLYGQ